MTLPSRGLRWFSSETAMSYHPRAAEDGREWNILAKNARAHTAVYADSIGVNRIERFALCAGALKPLPALIHEPLRSHDHGFALFPVGLNRKTVTLSLADLSLACSTSDFLPEQRPALGAVMFDGPEFFKRSMSGAECVAILRESGLFLTQPQRQNSLHR